MLLETVQDIIYHPYLKEFKHFQPAQTFLCPTFLMWLIEECEHPWAAMGALCKIEHCSPQSLWTQLCFQKKVGRPCSCSNLRGQKKGWTPKCWSDRMQLDFLLSCTNTPLRRLSCKLYRLSLCCVEKGLIKMSDRSVIWVSQVRWVSAGSDPVSI